MGSIDFIEYVILWPLLLCLGASAGSYCWFGGAMSNLQAESGTPC